MITISLCMIVKNEEKTLARCLDSIAHLMDEIIIVDTGSSDRTKEIAGRYTSEIYDYEWNDDFAAARNYALSFATKEYIYVADADEVLDKENQKRFMELKQVLLPEIDIVQMYYGNQLEFGSTYNFDKEYRPKLFKRVRTFQFIHPIHEVLSLEPVIYDSEVEITHKPHECHAKRDFSTFQKIIGRGERLSKHLINMYAKELYISGENEDFLEAYPYYLSVLKDSSRQQSEQDEARCIVVKASRLAGDLEVFLKYALGAVASNPSSEICYEIGEYYYNKEDYTEAKKYYEFAHDMTSAILNIHCASDYPEEKIQLCNKKINNSL